MKRIYKFPIQLEDEFTLSMPANAEPLCIQVQHGTMQLWALVDPEQPHRARRFAIRGTGHEASDLDASMYVGTVQVAGGQIVWHLFDRGEAR